MTPSPSILSPQSTGIAPAPSSSMPALPCVSGSPAPKHDVGTFRLSITDDELTFDGDWALELAGARFDVPAAAVRRRMRG